MIPFHNSQNSLPVLEVIHSLPGREHLAGNLRERRKEGKEISIGHEELPRGPRVGGNNLLFGKGSQRAKKAKRPHWQSDTETGRRLDDDAIGSVYQGTSIKPASKRFCRGQGLSADDLADGLAGCRE